LTWTDGRTDDSLLKEKTMADEEKLKALEKRLDALEKRLTDVYSDLKRDIALLPTRVKRTIHDALSEPDSSKRTLTVYREIKLPRPKKKKGKK
jgi:tetrahydromethanopterin S-methyltransferase subunit G